MALPIIALFLTLFHQVQSQSQYGSLSIDCGAENGYTDEKDTTWYTDFLYINQANGYNHMINKSMEYNPMNTLRIFPDHNKNCYTVPVFIQQKYLLRAGFYYGNYDGLFSPPSFDLQFDANSWAPVITSMDQPVFYEAVVVSRQHNISVCVARTSQLGVPFISTLQIMQLLPWMYSSIDNDHALFKEYRLNFGSNQTVSYPDDKYGRIWEPAPANNYIQVTSEFQNLLSSVPDDPPPMAMRTAIRALQPSESIILSFNVDRSDRPLYVALYFTELTKLNQGQNRTFDVYLNEQDYSLKLSPLYQRCNEIHGYTASSEGALNLTLAPSKKSNMPPIINAMELFTVSETLANGTAAEDVYGLGKVAYFSSRLRSWSGDPCLPVAWEWLSCNQDDPPRVTALYLANAGITFLNDFSDMQALEIIDLQNNSLRGTIPPFLWNFPNLKELNLADNDIHGTVPESMVNTRVSLNVNGTNLIVPVPKEKKSHKGLIIGITVGVGVALIACAVIAFVCICSNGDPKVGMIEMTRAEGENQEGTPPVNQSNQPSNTNSDTLP